MDEIKFKQVNEDGFKVCAYKITPYLCREQSRTINIDDKHLSIHVSRRGVIPKKSPIKKVIRQDSTVDNRYFELLENKNIDECIDEDSDHEELVSILPDVIQNLKECDKYEDFMSFNRLISERKFPMSYIAFLLFLDVVRWFTLDNTTSKMRCRNECKMFWRTGYKLFHGRFLRFMGGPKNLGQVLQSDSSSGNLQSKDSKVNFIVPHRKLLQEDIKMVSTDTHHNRHDR